MLSRGSRWCGGLTGSGWCAACLRTACVERLFVPGAGTCVAWTCAHVSMNRTVHSLLSHSSKFLFSISLNTSTPTHIPLQLPAHAPSQDQDGGKGRVGILVEASSEGWWKVAWEVGGKVNGYRVGAEGCHDLKFAPVAVTHVPVSRTVARGFDGGVSHPDIQVGAWHAVLRAAVALACLPAVTGEIGFSPACLSAWNASSAINLASSRVFLFSSSHSSIPLI